MTLVVCYSYFTCLLSTQLFMLLLFSCCLSCYLVILCLQLFLLLFYVYCLYTRVLLFTHTLTRSLSDDPGFARPDIGRFVSIVQVFDETVRFARSWTLSLLILVFSPLFIPVSILFLIHAYQIHSLFQCFLYDIMRGCLYVKLQWLSIDYGFDL